MLARKRDSHRVSPGSTPASPDCNAAPSCRLGSSSRRRPRPRARSRGLAWTAQRSALASHPPARRRKHPGRLAPARQPAASPSRRPAASSSLQRGRAAGAHRERELGREGRPEGALLHEAPNEQPLLFPPVFAVRGASRGAPARASAGGPFPAARPERVGARLGRPTRGLRDVAHEPAGRGARGGRSRTPLSAPSNACVDKRILAAGLDALHACTPAASRRPRSTAGSPPGVCMSDRPAGRGGRGPLARRGPRRRRGMAPRGGRCARAPPDERERAAEHVA